MKYVGKVSLGGVLVLLALAIAGLPRPDRQAVHCGCDAYACTMPCADCCAPVSCRGMQGYGLRDLVEDEPADPVVRPR